MWRHRVLLLMAASALAGAAQAQATPSGCSGADAARFDFWLGDWTVRWTNADGSAGQGRNRIARTHDGCVIHEQFDGRPGTPLVGSSHSVWDAKARLWRQTWVDNHGGYLAFEGGWEGEGREGRMVLVRAAVVEGRPVRQRMVFRDIEADRLVWDWQRSDDEGRSWTTTWQIRYERSR